MSENVDGRVYPCYSVLLLAFWYSWNFFASKVSSLYAAGNYEAALQASKDAGKWTKIGFIVGLVVIVLYLLVYGAAFFSMLN